MKKKTNLLEVEERSSQEGEDSFSMFYLNPPHDPFKLHPDSHTATLASVEALFVMGASKD